MTHNLKKKNLSLHSKIHNIHYQLNKMESQ